MRNQDVCIYKLIKKKNDVSNYEEDELWERWIKCSKNIKDIFNLLCEEFRLNENIYGDIYATGTPDIRAGEEISARKRNKLYVSFEFNLKEDSLDLFCKEKFLPTNIKLKQDGYLSRNHEYLRYPIKSLTQIKNVLMFLKDAYAKFTAEYDLQTTGKSDALNFKIVISEVEEELADSFESKLSTSSGQGIKVGPQERKAIEKHSMDMAKKHFSSLGYKTHDVSKRKLGYDLLCEKGKKKLYVEVKGTQTGGLKVLLTKNEVAFAKNNAKNISLYVLNSIRVVKKGKKITAVGGKKKILNPWEIQDKKLKCLSYVYNL